MLKQEVKKPENVVIEERITKVNGDFHIKRYQQGKFLGKGGFAHVFLFTSLENNKLLAGKVISKVALSRSRSKQKLMNEIRLHKGLFHPNIVKFEHVFEDQENVYILLELCEHQSLSELLKRRKKLTEFEVQYYIVQMVDALLYLHANRIIHRDLKLGNIFLSEKMEAKLGDFGLAVKLEFDGEKKRTICGTPNYIAPEVLEGKSGHSYQADVWSLGVMIYTLLIGTPPFETTDIKLTYKKIKECSYTFPPNHNLSSNAKDLIMKILRREPEKRIGLNDILQHPFINHGGQIPKTLPQSTLACPPTNNYIKQFAAGNGASIGRFSQLVIEPDMSNILSSSRLYGAGNGNNTARGSIHVRAFSGGGTPTGDLFRGAKTTRSLSIRGDALNMVMIHGYDKFKQILAQSPLSQNEKQSGDETKDVTPPLKKYKEIDFTHKIEEELEECTEDVRVIKWYDYSAKYGLGYALSNGTVGVSFNDGSKLILNKDKFEYIVRNQLDKQEVFSSYKVKEYPQEINTKVQVYNKFKERFEPALKNIKEKDTFAYVKKWIKTKSATFFRMNTNVLQAIFNDESVIVINYQAKTLLFIDTQGNEHKSSYQEASTGDNKDLLKRLKYVEESLKYIWNAQQNNLMTARTSRPNMGFEPE